MNENKINVMELEKQVCSLESEEMDDTIYIELKYPRNEKNKNKVQVGLMDVRAADDILIEYDFERDGWVIKQASKFQWEIGEKRDEDWQEVAFIQAWGRER